MMNFISIYNKISTKATLTGINKLSKKCSISLSFSTLPLLYSTCNSVCQDPRQNKYRRLPPLLREPTHLRSAGQPAPQSHKKLRFIREFQEFQEFDARIPVCKIPDASITKMADLREFWSLATGK